MIKTLFKAYCINTITIFNLHRNIFCKKITLSRDQVERSTNLVALKIQVARGFQSNCKISAFQQKNVSLKAKQFVENLEPVLLSVFNFPVINGLKSMQINRFLGLFSPSCC